MDKNSLGELTDEDWLVKEKNASVRLCNKLKNIIQKKKNMVISPFSLVKRKVIKRMGGEFFYLLHGVVGER